MIIHVQPRACNDRSLTRIAVIADTHLPRGSRRLSPQCLDLLAAADLILHAGDVTTTAALRSLRELGPLEAVCGNMDDPALHAALPEERIVEIEGARIGMVHIPGPAVGRSARLAARFPGCDAVVYGHTHLPELSREGSTWILNPGSPTERRRAPGRTMLEILLEDGRLEPRLVTLP